MSQPGATAAAPPASGQAPTSPAGASATGTVAAEHASDAAGTPATGQQIARVVQQQFPTYDADSSGTLNPAEFASWMTVLRKASEPGFEPDAPEAKAWMAQAFAIADADKSASLSQAEVANFLSQGSKTPS